MARTDPHFKLRIPEDVKSWVVNQAILNRRSITAEIIVLIEKAMNAAAGPSPEKANPAAAPNATVSPAASTHAR